MLKGTLEIHLLMDQMDQQLAKAELIQAKIDEAELWKALAEQLVADQGWVPEQPAKVGQLEQLRRVILLINKQFFLMKESTTVINLYFPARNDEPPYNLYFDISALDLSAGFVMKSLSRLKQFGSKAENEAKRILSQTNDEQDEDFLDELKERNQWLLQNAHKEGQDNSVLNVALQIEQGKGLSEQNPAVVPGHEALYDYLSHVGLEPLRQYLLELEPYPLDKMELKLSNTGLVGVLFFIHKPEVR